MLDLGCGRATMLRYLPRATLYTGVEREPGLVDELRAGHPGHRFVVADLDGVFPALGERYDTVLLLAVLEHLGNPGEVIRRCHDLLLPGGSMVITVPTRLGELVHRVLAAARLVNPEVSRAHLWRFDASSLRELFEGLDGEVAVHRLFQLGCNRMVVFRKGASDPYP